MKGKNTLVLCLVAMLLMTAMAGVGTSPPATRVYVDPSSIIDPTGTITQFSVDVNVESVSDLYGWSAWLLFNPAVVHVEGVSLSTWLSDESGWGTWSLTTRIDNIFGSASFGQILNILTATNGATGSGTLATITFKVVGSGVTILDLDQTKLNTKIGSNNVEIPHVTDDGFFDNRETTLPPNAFFEAPTDAVAGELLTFDASGSNDADDGGWIVSYEWDFGDGVTEIYVEGVNLTTTATHAYSRGYYPVTLTVTDNDGLTDIATSSIEIVVWMVGGTFPDLVGWEAKPERPRLNEGPESRTLNLRSLAGNPTEDEYEVYAEFTLFSKDEAKKLGTLTTDVVTLSAGEKRELPAVFDTADPMWRAFSGSPEWVPFGYYHWMMHKYTGFASLYYKNNTTGEFEKGNVVKYFGFNVVPMEHDVAVLNVIASPDTVAEGGTMEINVTMTNNGDMDEPNLDLTLSYVGPGGLTGTIETRNVTIPVGESITETFTWDTSLDGLPPNPYLIVAKLPNLAYETAIGDNSQKIKVYITS